MSDQPKPPFTEEVTPPRGHSLNPRLPDLDARPSLVTHGVYSHILDRLDSIHEILTSPVGHLARLQEEVDMCLVGLRSVIAAVMALEELQGPMPSTGVELLGVAVLVVDDESLMQAAMRRVLGAAGAGVVCARGPTEAISAFAVRNDIGAALVDLRLQSEFDGMELCRHIQNTHPTVGIVIMTGMLNDADRSSAKELGIRVLEKPCHNADVIAALVEAHAARKAPAPQAP